VAQFTTADLSDDFPDFVEQLDPIFRDYGGVSRFAGPIETVRVFEDNGLIRGILESEGQGKVLVVDGGGSLKCALVGGRLAALAHERGWSGLIVNGCIRDTDELRRVGLGIRALNVSPKRGGKSGSGARNEVLSFAGVSFHPGRFLYADGDGILLARRNLLADSR
jgi:regulator of ribonuclease activity A